MRPEETALIVRDQLRAIHRSGIMDLTDKLHITLLGNLTFLEDLITSRDLLPLELLETSYAGEDTKLYEFPTLERLQRFCQEHVGGRVWYMHNKGSTYSKSEFRFFAVWAWRKMLEHYLLHSFPSCLSQLDAGYDTCGANYVEALQGDGVFRNFYSGNFWSARCDYVQRLPNLSLTEGEVDRRDRYRAETWVGSTEPKGKMKNCFTPWDSKLPRSHYAYIMRQGEYAGTTECEPPLAYRDGQTPWPDVSDFNWREQFQGNISRVIEEFFPEQDIGVFKLKV